ncbi:GDP-mannose 4,6-dehydratase [Candidatus Thioglobus sp.]|nr:GDP-mannose 4,6-dehydratase [Candidatus Thioglobus sp.]
MNQKFWQGKNVFITGINGFIGGNLAKDLLDKGANVFGLVRNQSFQTFLYFESLEKEIIMIRGELTDKELLNRVMSENNINVVYHLAAQVEVGVGLLNPYLTFETNIRGTYTLLEAIRAHGELVESVIFASTDKAYGTYAADQMPYKENYPLLPKYPYDTSKACSDMIAQVYANEIFKMPIAITRFSNIYGPGQLNFSALIPDSITSALGFSKFIPRGDGSMIRDFLYVGDVVDLYLRIGESMAISPEKISGEVFNAGTNKPISVRDILEVVYKLAGNKSDFEEILNLMNKKQTVGEIQCQYMNYDKVNEYFKWSPTHSLQDGLIKSIEWYKRWNKK